jgi:L,D-peptidoglycan transpeptidase YkuD (ErfK/YbiS/YcfS/YnhG family)
MAGAMYVQHISTLRHLISARLAASWARLTANLARLTASSAVLVAGSARRTASSARLTASPVRVTALAGLAAAVFFLTAQAIAPALAQPAAPSAGRSQVPADAEQLIVVSSPTSDPPPPGYLASLRAYERASSSSPWRAVFSTWQAETGSGHLLPAGARREGDHATPLGVFGIGATMYGNEPNPGELHYAYHRLVCGDWWDEDPYSAQYNRFVHVRCGSTPSFAAWSEALWTETVAYPYFAVIEFNMNPTIAGANALGSGIFLHSWVGGATEGCVALPRARLLELLRWLEPAAHPVIEIEGYQSRGFSRG